MREWQKPQIEESQAGMEVTSYLPAELDRKKHCFHELTQAQCPLWVTSRP